MAKQNDGYFLRVHKLSPTRYWVNNPTRAQARQAIECGAVSCTTNPTYISKVLKDEIERPYVLSVIKEAVKDESDDAKVVEKVQSLLVKEIADCFMSVYEKSDGENGFVSIQGDPFNETSDKIVSYGEANTRVSPNIIPKIPVTPEGLPGIRKLLKMGHPILATEVMCVQQFVDAAELYEEIFAGKAHPPYLFFAHIAGIFDEHVQHVISEENIDISHDIAWQAGIAVMKKIQQLKYERGYRIRSLSGGARGLHHFTEMVGADSGVTINWTGTSEELIKQNPVVVQRFLAHTSDSVIDSLNDKLALFRKAYNLGALSPSEYEDFGPVKRFRTSFENGWTEALETVRLCRDKML
jgi:transaldolase